MILTRRQLVENGIPKGYVEEYEDFRLRIIKVYKRPFNLVMRFLFFLDYWTRI